MTSPKEMTHPLFRITPLKFEFLAQLCKPIFGDFSPTQRLKASSSRALWDLCVQGHESCFLVALFLWFPMQQIWHRFTSSSARAQQGHSYRSVSLLAGDSRPVGRTFCTHWILRVPQAGRCGEVLSASMNKGCFCVASTALTLLLHVTEITFFFLVLVVWL